MSIRSSRILGQLHPWFRERIEFLEAVTKAFRGTFLYFSGYRSREEQRRLFITRGPLQPVAAPGCSQHNHFGPNGQTLAVDVGIFGSVSEEGFTTDEFNRGIDEWARHVGLTTVSKDPGHFQVFPGPEFKSWAVASGFCNPNPPPRSSLRNTVLLCGPNALGVTRTITNQMVCFFKDGSVKVIAQGQ